ncbi:hypothetical protein AALP_AA8G357600 [Arabis alpina]|uniref:Uncharacterized protein n=1 Tax=Arabis alpina TaxID=50452 RepID=A0A087GBJ9_ARAAL|nr:hypothetical protein AALP_AA8G357600 [Arabis alpina]
MTSSGSEDSFEGSLASVDNGFHTKDFKTLLKISRFRSSRAEACRKGEIVAMEEQSVDGIFGFEPDDDRGGVDIDPRFLTSRTEDPTARLVLEDSTSPMRPDVLRVTDVTTGPNITRVPDVSGCHGLMFPPCTDDPSRVTVTEDPLPHLRTEEARGSDVGRGTDLDDPGRHTDVSRTRDPNDLFVYPEGPTRVVTDEEDLASSSRWASSSRRARDPRASFGSFEDGMIPLNDEDPELPFGNAFASSSSSSLDSRASSVERDDEDIVDEVEQTKKAASTQRVKVRPDHSGSTLSKKDSL